MSEPTFTSLPRVEQEIVYYIHHCGPVFEAKLAKRLNRDREEVRGSIGRLQERGLLQRVTGRLVGYKPGGRGKVVKSRNHTYFELTRPGRLMMRGLDVELDVNLRPPWKQA
jgi:predicted ArsR family transcriptional regulator